MSVTIRKPGVRAACRWAAGAASLSVVALLALSPATTGSFAAVAKLGNSELDEKLMARQAELEALRQALVAVPKVGQAATSSGRRRALVIGNEEYLNIGKLRKAVGDSQSIAATLTDLGFAVTPVMNADTDTFDEKLELFFETLQPGDTGVLFYSGHGIAFEGKNYLLPVDIPALTPEDGRKLKRLAIDANEMMERFKARQVDMALVVLDACRDDPFARDDTKGAVPLGGLAPIEPKQGMFVIYSAGVGEKALDNLGIKDAEKNSVFTRKFIPILATPGLPLVDIAKRTQVEVRELARTVHHRQAPAYYDQVIGQYYFRPPQPKLYGFSIGIGDYEQERLRFKGASNDGTRVAAAIQSLGAEETVRILDRDARQQFIEFAWRKTIAAIQPGDTIVFSFSGQTGRRPAPGKAEESDGFDEFLKLANYSAENDSDAKDDEIITDDQLTAWLEVAANKNINVVLLVDGSSGGGLLDRPFANVSFIGASAEGQTTYVYQMDGRDHGAASASFAAAIEGTADLNGDGFISQRELFYLVSKGILDVARLRQTAQFSPAITGTGPGTATDIPLFRLPDRLKAGTTAATPDRQ